MARDKCIDCEGDFPFGEGLKDGRCPDCRAIFEQAQAEAPPAAELADEAQERGGGFLGAFRPRQPEGEKPAEEE